MLGVKIHQTSNVNFEMTSQSSSNFASFFIVTTHNSSVNFNLILFLLSIKRSHQSPNFESFKCPGENLAYSSCHFPSYKSFFLQICITPQCHERKLLCTFLCQTLNTLHNRNKWKCKLFRLWLLASKFTKFLSFFKQQISFNFASIFRVMRHNSSVYTFSAKILYTFNKRIVY